MTGPTRAELEGRSSLAAVVITTICGVGSITLTALGAHGFLVPYLWPAAAVSWCWIWYGADRASRAGGAS